MFRLLTTLALVGTAALASPLAAQSNSWRRPDPQEIPVAYRPPPGMCRIWITNVPANQQPAPTDCKSAVRNRPANGRVIFGDDYAPKKKKKGKKGEKEGRDSTARSDRRPDGTLALGDGRTVGRWDDDGYDEDELDDEDYDRRRGAGRGVCIDRDRDGRCDDLARDSDGCIDRNRDGRCDDARYDFDECRLRDRYGRPYDRRCAAGSGYAGGLPGDDGICIDRNRDGRCDEPWSDRHPFPQTLPDMISAVLVSRGQASYDAERWLRRTDLTPRFSDTDRNGEPERVTWLDASGRVVQIWSDRDRDGIADRVEIFRDGRRVQVIGR